MLGLLDTSSFLAIAGYIINLLLMLADFVTGHPALRRIPTQPC